MNTLPAVDLSKRDPLSDTDPRFVQRWSPRYFQPVPISEHEINVMLDAARWSPSCYNEQPWHFYISDERSFARYLDMLVEGNQAWAKHTSAIGFITARQQFSRNGKPNGFAAFDCGAAWMAFCLQANQLGWYVHGMGGIAKDKIIDGFGLDPDAEKVIMGFAIGKLGDLSSADADTREKETPNHRHPLATMVTRG